MDTGLRHTVLLQPRVWRPGSPEEAWSLKHTFGTDGVYISGGTLLRTQWESGAAAVPAHLIDLSAIGGISGISAAAGHMTIGALTLLAALRKDSSIALHFPLLTEAVRSIAAPSIRNLGTIGGNAVSSAGDAIPALLVYGAELAMYDGGRTTDVPIADWLTDGGSCPPSNRQSPPHQLLLQIKLPFARSGDSAKGDGGNGHPLPQPAKRFGAFHKIGRREAFTPSVVTAAVSGGLAKDGRIHGLRIAAGGGQTVPRRLTEAESVLEGKRPEPDALAALYEAVLAQYKPCGDSFADADYRRTTAANVIAASLWRGAGGARGEEEEACC